MYHIFFIHSSVDGHLGCFHVLAIVNRAALGCMYRFELRFSLDICPGVGLLNHMVVETPVLDSDLNSATHQLEDAGHVT